MSESNDPCKECGGPVRIRRIPAPTFGNPDGAVEQRVCLNRECATNAKPRTFGTPTP